MTTTKMGMPTQRRHSSIKMSVPTRATAICSGWMREPMWMISVALNAK